jgi:hypothetical protein
MDGEHGPFDPVVGIVDDCGRKPGGRPPNLTGERTKRLRVGASVGAECKPLPGINRY